MENMIREPDNRFSFYIQKSKERMIKIEKIKCKKCRQTLLQAEYVKGEIKCPRCGTINRILLRKGKSQ